MLLLGAVGALLAATLATQLLLQARQRDIRNDLVNHLDPARVTTADLRAAALDQETGIRGYALTRDPGFLRPYDDGQEEADDALARLRRLVGSGTRIDAELDRV
jgi:CHASE3 domain sensor protein